MLDQGSHVASQCGSQHTFTTHHRDGCDGNYSTTDRVWLASIMLQTGDCLVLRPEKWLVPVKVAEQGVRRSLVYHQM